MVTTVEACSHVDSLRVRVVGGGLTGRAMSGLRLCRNYRTEGPREPAAARGGAWAFHCPRLGDSSNTCIEKSSDRGASEWACMMRLVQHCIRA
jgi:hypothetical protein